MDGTGRGRGAAGARALGVAVATAVGAATVVAGCGSAPAPRRAGPPPTTIAVGDASLRAALVAYFEERGIRSTEYLLKTAVSGADPTWAMFSVPEADDANASIRGDEGLARQSAPGLWGVVAFGVPGTVCPSGIPARVASELALSCG